MVQRTAKCGHAYSVENPQGPARSRCAECQRAWDRRPGRPDWSSRGRAASEARWSSAQSATCLHCFGTLPPKRPTGPRSSYCSTSCRDRASYARRKDRVNAEARERNRLERAGTVKACIECGKDFSPKKSLRQELCSTQCAGRRQRDSSTAVCSEPDCDRNVRAKGLCNMHYKRALRAEGRMNDKNWTPARKAAWQARRALTRGAPDAEKFDYADIFERDGWVCGICTLPVDRDLKWPHPMSASLDHVTPLSRGGRHSRDNVQCSHLTCNLRKSNRVDVAEL